MTPGTPAQPSAFDWPDSLDAVIAAPEHHRVLIDNQTVRVLETVVPPGETVRLHTHRWPAVYYFLETSDFVRRDEAGGVTADTRKSGQDTKAGQAVWAPPLGPHSLENVGTSPIRVVSVEIKTAIEP